MPDIEAKIAIDEGVKAFAQSLEKKASDVEKKKQHIEKRWYDDLRQYNGKYDEKTETKLEKNPNKSSLFVHLTRPKTDTWIARTGDLLFPTDEKNWGINPTPEPELTRFAQDNTKPDKKQAAAEFQQEAKDAAESMSRKIEDQLVENSYAAKCRTVIEDACILGTGVLKGPIDTGQTRRKWVKKQTVNVDGTVVQVDKLINTIDTTASFEVVNPWNYFPDPDAVRKEDIEFEFERHLVTKKKLKEWSRLDGFNKTAIRKIISEKSTKAVPDYLNQIRAINGYSQSTIENKYTVWEYRGPIDTNDLKNLVLSQNGDQNWEELEKDIDPLIDVNAVVYVCQGEVIKFGLNHLESGDSIYSIFNFAKDKTSIWGFGPPYLMRASQSSTNAAWRMILDNGGLSSGPQIVINSKAIQPVDGNYELTPRKVWELKDDAPNGVSPFQVHHINNNQTELANIISLSLGFMDQEIGLPAPAQGEAGAQAGNTLGGLAILMNSTNVIFRKVVKNFDDELTVPTLRRLYDWNMQYSNDESIKGDMKVEARGSSVLLIREIQSQNLMQLFQMALADPEVRKKVNQENTLKKIVQSMLLPANEVLKSEEEIKQEEEREAQLAQQQQGTEQNSTDTIKLQIAQLDSETKLKLAEADRETALIRMATERDMTIEQLQTQLELKSIDADLKAMDIEQKIAVTNAELDIKEKFGSGI